MNAHILLVKQLMERWNEFLRSEQNLANRERLAVELRDRLQVEKSHLLASFLHLGMALKDYDEWIVAVDEDTLTEFYDKHKHKTYRLCLVSPPPVAPASDPSVGRASASGTSAPPAKKARPSAAPSPGPN